MARQLMRRWSPEDIPAFRRKYQFIETWHLRLQSLHSRWAATYGGVI